MDGLEEGTGESLSPQRCSVGVSPSDVKNDIYARLLESGHDEAVSNPDFRDRFDAHFSRLPPSYILDLNIEKAEDVLLHMKILVDAEDQNKRPIFHVRFLKYIRTRVDRNDDLQPAIGVECKGCDDCEHEGDPPPLLRNKDCGIDFEPCSKLEDLNLDVGKNDDIEGRRCPTEALSKRQEVKYVPIHEIIFSSLDKPKLLSKLSALLSDIGLNIREAHVFSTTDGYFLDVFVVDGWPQEGTDGLLKELKEAVARNESSLSGSCHSSHSSATEKLLAMQPKVGDWEIDRRFLKMGEKIACGSCGDLHRGTYMGQDVAIKVLRPEHVNGAQGVEFAQEVVILRKVHHRNVVRFIGACTKPSHFCILTEYVPRGNLYDFLHKHHNVLGFSQLLKFAIDVCEGMDYLHQNNIIHRDLKTANLLMGTDDVVKVADFGVARFQNQEGDMTAETGTYRWMAPEVINHQPYDHKVDVFSFAIVLWELATSKIPYESMTPLQAALGVRQGLRPELPKNTDPCLLDLMQRCWDADPAKRPSFSEITIELEELLQQVQASRERENNDKEEANQRMTTRHEGS